MMSRAPIVIPALILIAGSIVMLFLVILSGVSSSSPLNTIYFLQADTSAITGARTLSRWTFFAVCGDNNQDCNSASPAMPFGSAWDSNPLNAPASLVGPYGGDTTSKTYWYLWRFGWVFLLMSLVLEVVTFFAGFIACCGRIGAAFSSLVATIALVFLTIGASLMTATFVQARDAFHKDNRTATIGVRAFGFVWAAWAALFLSTFLFCMGIRSSTASAAPSGRPASQSRWRRSSRGGSTVKEEYA